MYAVRSRRKRISSEVWLRRRFAKGAALGLFVRRDFFGVGFKSGLGGVGIPGLNFETESSESRAKVEASVGVLAGFCARGHIGRELAGKIGTIMAGRSRMSWPEWTR